jgi:hypothetical protein
MQPETREETVMPPPGSIHFDLDLTITLVDEQAKAILARCDPQADLGAGSLIAVFPEFVGREEKICKIITEGEGTLALEYVNRTPRENTTYYLHLTIQPGNTSANGIVLLQDVSHAGRAKVNDHQKTNERNLLLSALERAGQDRDEAARLLGTSRDELDRRLAQHGLL